MKSKVLLIEDGVTIHRVIDLYIDFDKFDLVKVFTREDADIKLKADKFDYILLDHKLENIILNSYVSELKTLQPNALIILLVGAFDRFNADTLAASGADDYITKPFDAQSLNSKLSSDEGVMKASFVEEIAVKDQLRDSNELASNLTVPQNISQNNIAPDTASQAASLATAVPGAHNKEEYLSSLEDSIVDDPTEDGYVDEVVEEEVPAPQTATLNLNETSNEIPNLQTTPSPEKLDPSLLASPLNLLIKDAHDDEEEDPVINDPIIAEENIGKETELFLDKNIENANELISEVAPVIEEADNLEEPTLSSIEAEVVQTEEVDILNDEPAVEKPFTINLEESSLSDSDDETSTGNSSEASPIEASLEESPAENPSEVLMHADDLPELDMSSLVDSSSSTDDDEEFTLTITSHNDEPALSSEAEATPTLEESIEEPALLNPISSEEENVDSTLTSASPIEETPDLELSLDAPNELPVEDTSTTASSEVLMHADDLPELDMSSLVDSSASTDDDEDFTLTITSHNDEEDLSSGVEPTEEPILEEPVSILGSSEPSIEMLDNSLNVNANIEEKEETPLVEEVKAFDEPSSILEAPIIEEPAEEPSEDISAISASIPAEDSIETKPLVDDDDWLSDAPGINDVVDILGTLPDKTDEVESEVEHSTPTLSENFTEEEPSLEVASEPISVAQVEELPVEEALISEPISVAQVEELPTVEAPISEPLSVAQVEELPTVEAPTSEPILAEDEEIIEEVVEEEVELEEDEEIIEEIVEEEVEELDEIEEEIKDEFAHDNVFQTDLIMDDGNPLAHIADTPMDDYSSEMAEAEEQLQIEEEKAQNIVPAVQPMPQNNMISPINTQFNGGGITISISREEILSMLGSAIDKQLLENAIKEVVAKNMQEIVRNVVPTVAEQYIKEEIERLKNDGK